MRDIWCTMKKSKYNQLDKKIDLYRNLLMNSMSTIRTYH